MHKAGSSATCATPGVCWVLTSTGVTICHLSINFVMWAKKLYMQLQSTGVTICHLSINFVMWAQKTIQATARDNWSTDAEPPPPPILKCILMVDLSTWQKLMGYYMLHHLTHYTKTLPLRVEQPASLTHGTFWTFWHLSPVFSSSSFWHYTI